MPPSPASTPTASRSGWFTTRPTGSTNGSKAWRMAAARAGSTYRGELAKKFKPTASAPNSAASTPSASVVMPQILTRKLSP